MTINLSWLGVFKIVGAALLVFVIYQQQKQIIILHNNMVLLNNAEYVEREEMLQHNQRQAQINLMLGIYIQKIMGVLGEGEAIPEVPAKPKEKPKTDHQKRNENLQRQLNGNPEYQV